MSGPLRISFVLVCSTVTLTGCSLTSFQSPEVLDPGDYQIGAGLSYASVVGYENGIPVLDVFGRRSLTSKFDGGLRLSGIGFVAADLKYQVLRNPVYVATDLGMSGGISSPLEAYALVLTGSQRLYLGGRVGSVLGGDKSTVDEEDGFSDAESNVSFGVLAGVGLGKRSPIAVEVGLHRWLGGAIFTIGIGHRRILGGK